MSSDERQRATSSDLDDDVSDHIARLQRTVGTQKQAQRLFMLAVKTRNDAATEAERLLRDAAAQSEHLREDALAETGTVREQLAAWLDERKQDTEKAAADLLATARRGSEEARSHTMRTAMADAEQTAAAAAARNLAAAGADAEDLRHRSRTVIEQAAEVAIGAQDIADELASSLTAQLARHGRALERARALLSELDR